MFLGNESEFVTRKYFEESVYRNILDLLNNLNDKANHLAHEIVYTAANTIGIRNKWYLYMIKEKRGVIGAAINAVGKSVGDKGVDTYYSWAKKVAKENNFDIKPGRLPLGITEVQANDLLNIGRSIEMEMNRVRLPTPRNFRQFLDKIVKLKLQAALGGPVPMASGNVIVANEVGLIEGIKAFRQLLDSIKIIQGEIRIIIDKAKLEVEEETLRRESDKLKNNKELAAQVEAEKQRIEREKIDYQNRIEQLVAEKVMQISQSNDERLNSNLNADVLQLEVQKQTSEHVATNQQREVIITAANTGTVPVQVPVEKTVADSFKTGKLLPIAAGALTLYSMLN